MAKTCRLSFLSAFIVSLACTAPVQAATFTWDGGAVNNSWGAAGNWNANTLPTFNNTADIVFHDAGAARLSNFIGASRTIRSLSFNTNVTTAVTIRTSTTDAGTTGSSLIFDGAGAGATLSTEVLYNNASNLNIGVAASNGNVTLADNLTINFNNAGAGNLTVSTPIIESGGARSVTSAGSGLVVLSAANTFTGGLFINSGTVRDSTASSFSGSTKAVTLGGGTLEFQRAYGAAQSVSGIALSTVASTSSTLVYNDTDAATANLTLSGTTTLAGNLHVNNTSSAGGTDALVWNMSATGAGVMSYSGTNQDVLNDLSSQRIQVNGDLSGLTGGIEIRKGIWLANAANALGGGAINIGVTASADSAAISLNANSATAISNAINIRTGAGTRLIDNTNVSGVARTWNGTATLDGALTYRSSYDDTFSASGSIAGAGALTKLGTGQLTLSGANGSYSGNISVSDGTVRALNASLGSGSIAVANGASLVLRQTTGSRSFANAISGAGTMTVSGGALIALSGANTLTGNITVADANTTMRIDNAAFNASTASIAITPASSILRLNANAASQTLANVISGSGSVIKQGTFQTTLTGANTYTGSTTVSAGALQVGSAGVGQTGTGAVTVESGGTILGTGVVRGSSLVVINGAIVHAGDSTAQSSYGTLTFTPVSGSGSFDFQSGSSTVLGINPGGISDKLSFTGTGSNTLLFNGNLTIGPATLSPFAPEVFDLFDWSGLSVAPTFASRYSAGSYGGYLLGNGDDNLGFDLPDISGSGFAWDISSFTTNGSIAIIVVPEPSRMIFMLIGVAGLTARRRREPR